MFFFLMLYKICSCRIVDPALKSLSVGVFLLVLRVFGKFMFGIDNGAKHCFYEEKVKIISQIYIFLVLDTH